MGVSFAATKKRRTAHSSKTRSARSTKPVSTKGAVASKGKSRRSAPVTAHSRRSFQAAPTPERYKEIQQALANKGYYKGQATGQWGSDSVEALSRFQKDQNLEPDGKIGSLSLIALGLGPKRMTAQAKPEPQTVAPNQVNPATQSKQ